MEWMNDLTQAVAFLESLNLAHGDLRPENILLDRNRLKLSDFDCTAEIGTYFEACMAPYGRLLNSEEVDQGESGTSGFLGPRTEQFALGSIFYFINYNFEVYGDRCLTDDPKEHGPKLVDLLQEMEFPKLNGNPLIDDIIDKCWHNKYPTIAELAADTKTLVEDNIRRETSANSPSTPELRTSESSKLGGAEGGEQDSYNQGMSQDRSEENFTSKEAFCRDLETRGLLCMLSSGEPEQLGFTLEWYRHLQT
jgi:serine/threonine protein kinase